VLFLMDGDAQFSRRCATERHARDVAEMRGVRLRESLCEFNPS